MTTTSHDDRAAEAINASEGHRVVNVKEGPPPDVLKKLKPRKCPACGADCVPRKGGFSGWFMGCPKFPKCPGKAPSLSKAQRQSAGQKLRHCFDFINRIGGVNEAKKWLELACEVVLAEKEKP